MASPVWPSVAPGKGHYESFYLRAADPLRPRGVWIRYTVHKQPGKAPLGSLWMTFFDGGIRAFKQSWAAPEPADWIRIGDATLGPQGARGRLDWASWDLAITPQESLLRHLPRDWMYRAPLPRTKPESPAPRASFSGHLEIGGERIDVEEWAGMLGHNWGTEHAAQWIWLHSAGFGDRRDEWIDLTIGRVRVGPVLTPWIASGACAVAGRRRRLGGPGRRVRVNADARSASVSISGQAEITVTSRDIVVWRYAAPDLSERHSAHSSNAQLALQLPGEAARRSAHGAAYELGLAPGAHGDLPVQPHPDGV